MELEPDLVKLDIHLFKRAYRGEGLAREVVQALCRLAERTGFQLVVEGVETESELAFALTCGTRLIQGYLLGRPQATFLEADALKQRIERTRRLVFYNRVALHRESRSLVSRIESAADGLRQRIEHLGETALHNLASPCNAILRCFITCMEGHQLSPDYDVHHGRFQPQALSEPRNWSWRPYFAEIVARLLSKAGAPGASSPYMDLFSAQMVQTFGIALSSNRILMIDVLARDSAVDARLRQSFA